MAPPSIKDQLPLLNKVVKWFQQPGLVIDSPLFRLHHQATSFILMLGFLFISLENYLDTKSIVCHNNASPYAKSYCWIHGYSYVAPQLQNKVSGCHVDQRYLTSPDDAPVTNYYLWLPYLLSLLFLLCKLPHTAWKKYFENNLISQILGGHEENWDSVGGVRNFHPAGGGVGVDQQGGKKNKNNQGNQSSAKVKISKPVLIANKFMEYRGKYWTYQLTFAFWETSNLLSVLASMQITHWLLNNKFWNYGLDIIYYLHNYQDMRLKGEKLHDPMCEVFPTEVSCYLKFGGTSGYADLSAFLCILGNNMFNQKYFFVLWLWWVMLLVISTLGVVYRLFRICNPFFSKYLLIRKVHGDQLFGVNMSSGDSFVLEMIVDNLTRCPRLIDEFMLEISTRLTEMNSRKSCNYMDERRESMEDDKTPLLAEDDDHQTPTQNENIVNKEDRNGDTEDIDAKVDMIKSMKCESPPHYSFVKSLDNVDNKKKVNVSANIVSEKAMKKAQEDAPNKCADNMQGTSKKKSKTKKSKDLHLPNHAVTSTPINVKGTNEINVPETPTEDDTINSFVFEKLNNQTWF